MLSFIFLVVVVLTQQTFAEEPEAIIGGLPAEPGEFPYQVVLKINGSHICGGSIIGPTKILTAAHCVYGIAHPYTNLKIRTGTIDFNEGQLQEVKSIRVHSEYVNEGDDVRQWVYDIAVITLSKPIQYNQYQVPIALADFEPVDGQQCILAGWGRTRTNGSYSQILQKINQVVMSSNKCQEYNITRLTEAHTCAYNRYGIGACNGDSGSPLVSNGKQIGIHTQGTNNCAIGVPDVYINVYHYREFILSS